MNHKGTTTLRDETLRLLDQRNHKRLLKDIAKEANLPLEWLYSFAQNKIPNPNVNYIQALYEYLSQRSLLA